MADYGDMITRVTHGIDRSVSSEDEYVRREIISAIETYKTERLRWTEKRVDLACVADQESYTSGFTLTSGGTVELEDIITIDWVALGPANSVNHTYDLRRKDSKTMAALSGISSTGIPIYWDFSSDAFWLYPTPDQAHEVQWKGLVDVNDVTYDSGTSEGSSNPWFNEAEEMIRQRAISNIYFNWLKNPERGQLFRNLADTEFRRHRSNYERLVTTDKGIHGWYGEADLDRGIFLVD